LIVIAFSASLTGDIFSLGQSCVNLNTLGAPPCVLGLIMYTSVLLIGLDSFLRSGSARPVMKAIEGAVQSEFVET